MNSTKNKAKESETREEGRKLKILSYFKYIVHTCGGEDGKKGREMYTAHIKNLSNLIIRMCTLTKGSTRRKIR
jgi:hypothetical protein